MSQAVNSAVLLVTLPTAGPLGNVEHAIGPPSSPSSSAVGSEAMNSTQDTQLLRSVLSGDDEAWQTLLARVHEASLFVVKKREWRQDDDFAHNVALRTIERIEKDDYRCLRQLVETQERYPTLRFPAWLRSLIRNSVVDEIRARPEYSRQRSEGKRSLVHRPHLPLEDAHAVVEGSSPFHRHIEVRRVMRWIHDPQFPEDQRRAILLWIDGHTKDEIAELLELAPGDASRLLRASRQRLRRRFEAKSTVSPALPSVSGKVNP